MASVKEEQPVYLLTFGRDGDRWRVALKTAVTTHYFISLEDLFLFLEAQSHPAAKAENVSSA